MELRELSELEPVSLVIKKDRLRWFECGEHRTMEIGSNVVDGD